MKSITSKLKEEINKLEDAHKRLQVLKDKYQGETVYIVAGGPSLKNYSLEYLNNFLKDKLVFSIKQSYEILKEVTDFHVLNFTNFIHNPRSPWLIKSCFRII